MPKRQCLEVAGIVDCRNEDGTLRGFDSYVVTLGDAMRGERATLGKTPEDVEAELKVKKSYILAIEDADPSVFAAPFVIAGYVRSYAKYLGLDPDECYRRFCEESGFANPGAGIHRRPPADEPRIKRKPTEGQRVPAPAFITPLAPRSGSFAFADGFSLSAVSSICVLLMLIGAMGYGGWTLLQEVQRVTLVPVNETPGVGSIVATLQGPGGGLPGYGDESEEEVVAGATSDGAGEDGLDRLYRPQVLDLPFVQRRDGPIAAINPDSFGTLAVPEAEPVQEVEPAPVVVETGPPVVEVVAANPAWVRIFVEDGDILFEKILDAEESFRIPEDVGFPLLRAGNSGSVYLVVDGATYGPVGSGTSVARRVDLTAANILEMYPVAEVELTGSHGAVENAEASRQE